MRANKSTQLQLRVSPTEKAAIRRAARRSGLDVSAYVLARALPALARRFGELTEACRDPATERFALAELHDWLSGLTGAELREGVAAPPPSGLARYLANYLAAMVESACARRGIGLPPWTPAVPPLETPVFGSTLASLRLHLLAHSPPPFRARNIFIDASIGARV